MDSDRAAALEIGNEAETHAGRDREIDHDLHRLPQVQNDRVRR
jgi:hypothetical protein